jgi:N-succinyldiaminopimelate aminotransferase
LNPRLARLHPYPFERLRIRLAGSPTPDDPVDLTIGEPQHPTPALITDAITANLGLLGKYPPTPGTPALRSAIAGWIERRFGVEVDADRGVIPVSGSREALFGFAQAVIDPADPGVTLLPNPFYQIYEGAAMLAGSEPVYVNSDQRGKPDWNLVPPSTWAKTKLVYVCSPGNPQGYCFTRDDWREIFDYADRFGFIVAADEPYSELYNGDPPVGALTVASELGFKSVVAFNSLSKRSSAPGLRSGFAAGHPDLIQPYLLYRTYHGAAPSLVTQVASAAAWSDDEHVAPNRQLYREKFAIAQSLGFGPIPEGGFFLWHPVPDRYQSDDEKFAQDAWEATGVKVLPGSYLARESFGENPGRGRVRIALVADVATVERGLRRLNEFIDPS